MSIHKSTKPQTFRDTYILTRIIKKLKIQKVSRD